MPPEVVTVTETVPVPAGDTAVQEVVDVQETPVADTDPNKTVVAPEEVSKFVPVRVTVVPPA